MLKVVQLVLILYLALSGCHSAQDAKPCDDKICKLPDCFCSGTKIPGGLDAKQVPQMVMITFDDSVNVQNFKFYEMLLNNGFSAKKNPNGEWDFVFLIHAAGSV